MAVDSGEQKSRPMVFRKSQPRAEPPKRLETIMISEGCKILEVSENGGGGASGGGDKIE